jgi:hypothetical protein
MKIAGMRVKSLGVAANEGGKIKIKTEIQISEGIGFMETDMGTV